MCEKNIHKKQKGPAHSWMAPGWHVLTSCLDNRLYKNSTAVLLNIKPTHCSQSHPTGTSVTNSPNCISTANLRIWASDHETWTQDRHRDLSCKTTSLTCPAQPQSPTPAVELLSAGCGCRRCPCWRNLRSTWRSDNKHKTIFHMNPTRSKSLYPKMSTHADRHEWKWYELKLCRRMVRQCTIRVIMMGSPYVISLVDSMRMTVRLMVIRTTPPRKAAAPISANVPG